MTDEYFAGFESQWIETPAGRFFARTKGPADAEALVLLHGFPQTHASWHKVAPALADNHFVVCLDLKGYGRSVVAAGDAQHLNYAKRTMGEEVIAVMAALGYPRFAVAGHDRGALIGYRMALDHPQVISRLAVLDNLPVSHIWQLMEDNPSVTPHWRTLALPANAPERRMDSAYFRQMLRVHTADGTLDCFSAQAMQDFELNWKDPQRVHAFCEDYRAGAFQDPEADRVDLQDGRTVQCPTLILWGKVFLGEMSQSPLTVWQTTFAPQATGVEVPGGHFNTEESPVETLAALRSFFNRE
jgi:haloacetate dehalogenase